jgi:ASCH domain
VSDTALALALTIHQPWAQLIILGRKTVELRRWETGFRGRFWIHAGKRENPALDARFGIGDPPRGAFLGSVELVNITLIDSRRWDAWQSRHLDLGPYTPGFYGWTLASPIRLRSPVPAPGQQNLFTVDAGIIQTLRNAETEAI